MSDEPKIYEFVRCRPVQGATAIVLRCDGMETEIFVTNAYSMASEIASDQGFILCDGYCHEFCGMD